MKLAVIGAGLAGAAAAHRAARLGMQVTWISAGHGASALGSGAADLTPWQAAPPDEPLPQAVHDFNRELKLWKLSERSCVVVSAAGVIRPARAIDPVTLDLRTLAGKTIGVPAAPAHARWGSALHPEALNQAPWALQSKTCFVCFDLGTATKPENIIAPEDHALGDVDLAATLATPERLESLTNALQARNPSPGLIHPALVDCRPTRLAERTQPACKCNDRLQYHPNPATKLLQTQLESPATPPTGRSFAQPPSKS